MNQVKVLLLMLFATAAVSCSTNLASDPPGARQGGAAPVKTELNSEGIVAREFTDPDNPRVIPSGQSILLQPVSDATVANPEFDVTFILSIPTSDMKSLLAGAFMKNQEEIRSEFESRLKEAAESALEVRCEVPPRCEVTYEVGPAGKIVPGKLLELNSANVTPFKVLLKRGTVYEEVARGTGFVRVDGASPAPVLRVPLDNTGIADLRFLNPRNPRFIPIALPTPTQPRARRPEAERALGALRQAVLPVTVSDETSGEEARGLRAAEKLAGEVRDLAVRAVERLEAFEASTMASRAEAERGQVRSELGPAFELVCKEAARVIGEVQDFAPRPDCEAVASSTREVPRACPMLDVYNEDLQRDQVREGIVDAMIWTVTEALRSMPGKQESTDLAPPPATDVIRLALAAVEALGATGEMVAETFAANGYIAEAGEKLNQICQRTSEALVVADAAQDSGVNEALRRLVTAQAVQDLQALAQEARARAEQRQFEATRASLEQQRVRFKNETADRTFVVTFDVQKSKLLRGVPPRALEEGEPPKEVETLQLDTLKQRYQNVVGFSITGPDTVRITLTVPSGTSSDIDAWLLSTAPKRIVPFDVDFFDQTDDPAFSKGFIAVGQIDPRDPSVEPESRFVSNLVTGVTWNYEPCLGTQDDCSQGISTVKPYEGNLRSRLTASGQLDLSQNLGNRANAKLSLAYDATDFGFQEDPKKDDPVRVSQYQVNTFATNGVIMTLGRFTFAAPASKIAISERGEGLRFALGPVALSYIVKRESNQGISNDHDKDSDALIAQWNKALPRSRLFRRANFTGVWGEDRCRDRVLGDNSVDNGECPDGRFPHSYWTLGVEGFFSNPFSGTAGEDNASRLPLTGSLAFYYSGLESDSLQPKEEPSGEGYTGLLTVGLPFDWITDESGAKVKPLQNFTALLGYGRGDKTETPKNEGYIGETAAFAPDTIFLSRLAAAIITVPDAVPDAKRVGRGLTNKGYFSLQYTNSQISPLDWLATLFKIHPRDIISQSSTLSYHEYWFVEPVFGSTNAGREFGVDFRMEQPLNVKWRVGAAYFLPGDALKETLVKQEPWVFTVGIIIEPAKLSF